LWGKTVKIGGKGSLAGKIAVFKKTFRLCGSECGYNAKVSFIFTNTSRNKNKTLGREKIRLKEQRAMLKSKDIKIFRTAVGSSPGRHGGMVEL
jgi:hypothetical protein